MKIILALLMLCINLPAFADVADNVTFGWGWNRTKLVSIYGTEEKYHPDITIEVPLNKNLELNFSYSLSRDANVTQTLTRIGIEVEME